RVCAVQTFDATAVGPILPITHERTGFEGIIGYETHFSGHGHEVHSPFDNHDSKSTSDFSGGVDGGFTVYQLHRTGSEIHPADGYDGPQGGGYPEPQGARDIYSYHIKGTSTKTKINTVPQAPFSDRWLKENAGAASGFFSRADEAGKLIWENNPNQNWRGNRMDDVRGIIQGAVNPFLTGFQGVGIGAITDSAVSPVTDTAAQQTLQGINDLGNLSPEAQLAAASLLQDSAFAVKDGINSARQWADAHPNITATAQTALAVAEAAGTVWRGKKVELNPTKWDWVKNTGYKKPAARHMQTVDGEMAGGNRPLESKNTVTTNNFFENTGYTEKVLRQASNGDYHGFPQSVDAFSENGTVIQIVGGDNIVRHKLYIPGSYKGKDGNFEYIREADGKINHRLFVPNQQLPEK
ncbi:polymorphic toxin MafB class 3, partial [Neisseria gonorrhoeae]